MCLLSYYPAGIMPDAQELMNGATANPDGHGYALATATGELIVRRGLTQPDRIIDSFITDRKRHPSQPAMFHSRFGTGGTFTKSNVHPFTVGRDRRTVVAHNGVLFRVPDNERRSDTRIFAQDIMPARFRQLDKPGPRRALQAYLTRYNKLAVITVNPRYRERGYVINETSGIWTWAGAWHSNDDYVTYEPYGSYAIGEDSCVICWSVGTIDAVTLVCDVCGFCQDCREHKSDCQCYTPAAGAREASAVVAEDMTRPAWWKDDTGRNDWTARDDQLAAAITARMASIRESE